MRRPHDLIVTGVPRSGTTLTCHLLNDLDDTVALHEPMPVRQLAAQPRSKRMSIVEEFFDDSRRTLLSDGTARSKQAGGQVPDNPIGARGEGAGELRQVIVTGGRVHFDKTLTPGLTLCIKHNAGFAAMLPDLVERFECLAVVRNPLATLGSWCSVDLPVNDGRIPAAERLDDELSERLDALSGVRERQLHVLEWMFARFAACLPRERILRYEDLVASGGRALAVAVPAAAALDRELTSRNKSPQYDSDEMRRLGAAILDRPDASWWDHYDRADIERIIEEP